MKITKIKAILAFVAVAIVGNNILRGFNAKTPFPQNPVNIPPQIPPQTSSTVVPLPSQPPVTTSGFQITKEFERETQDSFFPGRRLV